MRESYESNSKPLDLGATHSYFLKTQNEHRMTITEQCAEENRFAMTMLDMYNQIETNRKYEFYSIYNIIQGQDDK